MRRALAMGTMLAVGILLAATVWAGGADPYETVEHHYADHDGVKIHYVTMGEGPVILFVHGFPDFWYSWREQMVGLSDQFKVAALDLRGYNKSDKPEGISNYAMPLLLGDVGAVVDDLGVEQVNLTGHDWGGAIAWYFAMGNPERVKNLVILNLTHPKGYASVIANPTEAQLKNTEYARNFATPGSHEMLNADMLAMMVAGNDEVARERYKEGMNRSSLESMVAYYQANYGAVAEGSTNLEMPNLAMPVLQFHGLKDTAVDKDGLKGTWDWIDRDYTLVAVPDSGHWVQRDAADLVTTTMEWWLLSRQ